jgi:hypothetical protein
MHAPGGDNLHAKRGVRMKAFLALLARIFASRRSLGLVVLALLIAVRMSDPLPLEELRLRSFDWFQTIAPRSEALSRSTSSSRSPTAHRRAKL